jgi:tetratricopeptide (TPR) repeat protein
MKIDKKALIFLGCAAAVAVAVLYWLQTGRVEEAAKPSAPQEAGTEAQAPSGAVQSGAAAEPLPQDYFQTVLQKLKTGDKAQLEQLLAEVEKQYPTSAFPSLIRAKLARDGGSILEAARLVVETAERWPGDPQASAALAGAEIPPQWAYLTLARDALKNKDFDAAEKLLGKVIALDGGNVSARYNLAVAAYGRGDKEKGVALLEEVLRMDPRNRGYYINLAGMKANMGDFSGAEKTLNDLLRMQPDNMAAKSMLENIKNRKK